MTQHRIDAAALRIQLQLEAASEAAAIVALEKAKGRTLPPDTREALERKLLARHEAQLAPFLKE